MLGKLLSQRHGFRCTVLFAIDREGGYINPNENTNIPHTEALDSADLMIIATRFRSLPDEQLICMCRLNHRASPLLFVPAMVGHPILTDHVSAKVIPIKTAILPREVSCGPRRAGRLFVDRCVSIRSAPGYDTWTPAVSK